MTNPYAGDRLATDTSVERGTAILLLVDRAIAAAGRLGSAQARLDAVVYHPEHLVLASGRTVRIGQVADRADLERRVATALEELQAAAADVRRAVQLEVTRSSMPTMHDVARSIDRISRRRAGEAALALALGPTPPEAP